MKLWTLSKGDYDVYTLIPVQYSKETINKCVSIASVIPGANVDIDSGEVIGPSHALRTCLKAAGQLDVRVPLPFNSAEKPVDLEGKLPEYQQWGRSFISDQLESGVMCNDDVGLGKTIQTLAALACQDERVTKIILCPAFLRPQWEGEIQKWWPLLGGEVNPQVHVMYPPSDPRSKRKVGGAPSFIVAYYLDASRAVQLARQWSKRGYYLVIDEVHNVRGYKTARLEEVKAACTFAQGRVSLTASLLYNDGARLFPILDFTSPGAWGNFYSFAKRYAGATEGLYGLEMGKLTHVEELRDRLRDMSFRRTKEEVADQLPFDTKYQTVWLDPPPRNIATLRMGLTDKGFVTMNQLVAEHKSASVVEQVASDRNAGVPSIVFTWLTSQADDIGARLPDSIVLHGKNSQGSNRLARLNQYLGRCRVTGDIPVLVCTIDAMGEGANLQWAKAVNIAAIDPTPEKTRQAVGRAARMGQTGTVTVRLFACKHTYDERLIEIVRGKLAENFKLDGRKEKSKLDLDQALSPTAQRDVLKEMLERYTRLEKLSQ